MSEKRLYELINPSDAITFRATAIEAACIANRMGGAYFVKDKLTGEAPIVPDLAAEYEAIWRDAGKIASYADAYRSFLVGTAFERELFEAAVARMDPAEAAEFKGSYHDKRCTSMNDICQQAWDGAEKIAAYAPETTDAA